MTTILRGPVYTTPGRWQTLSFADLKRDLTELLQQEIWVLRTNHGEQVTAKDAYIDKVALNVYTTPGSTRIDLDDLKVEGQVAAQPFEEMIVEDSQVAQASAIDQETGKPKALVVRDGTILLAKGKPFFPRVIEHNGEKLEYLKALGFNVVQLRRTATYEQLKEAKRLNIWLICPPPSTIGLQPIPLMFDRVLAWQVGEGLKGRNVKLIERTVREIRESDARFGRLVIGHADAEWSQVARITDILGAGVEPVGTSFLASQYSDWITARRQSIGNEKPVWADIQTELSAALQNQIRTLTTQPPPTPLEPQQVKFLVYEAITGGARGLYFRSRNRLDGVDPVTMLRTLTLRWVNAHLVQLEPWIVGGALMGKLPASPTYPNLEVTAINTNRSRLLLVQRPTHHEQFVSGDQPPKSIAFHDVDSPFTDNAYLMGQAGLVTLPNARTITGTEIKIDACPYVAAVVLTQDPIVVNRLTQGYDITNGESILTMHTQLTEQWIAIQQLIDGQMGKMGRGNASASGALNEAVTAFRNARNMINQSNPSQAASFLQMADQRLALARRELVTVPLGKFQSKTSAPLTVHCSLIPLHWELAGKLARGTWNPNGLPAGDFEDLKQMVNAGWVNRRLDNPAVTTRVELTPESAKDGSTGMKLTVQPKGQGSRRSIETPPLIIESPPVTVRAGQLIRIHGWVKIPEVIVGSMDGLRITDSLSGPEMVERIPFTQGWQEFTLYRSAGANGMATVKFELSGYGSASIDEVTIRAIDLPSMSRQARR